MVVKPWYMVAYLLETDMEEAADLVGLPTHVRRILAEPKNELIVHFPVRMDNGETRVFKGYRIQHNNVMGPYKGGMRYHEMVSLDELKSVGLTQDFARTVGIAVDHRRHNKNADTMATNVERLTQYKNKLILFPRVGDKPKKGEINDSTADKLTGAVQNTTDGVFGIKKVTKRCKIETLTADMKKFNAYQKLRQARIEKKMHGKKIKAAKDAEKAKK